MKEKLHNISRKIIVVVAVMGGIGLGIGWFLPADNALPKAARHQCASVDSLGDMIAVAGGEFLMGSDGQWVEERPPRVVTVNAFHIRKYEVTNREFAAFVEATGYVTTAERTLDPNDFPGFTETFLQPGSAVFIGLDGVGERDMLWRYVHGANWRQPTGPDSSISGLENHPVVHVSYEDALAYADWRGEQLPTEAQWEFAARGGLLKTSVTSRDISPDIANTWQGVFPFTNTSADGYTATAPVGCFPANDFGLHDVLGNVWEWTRSEWTRSEFGENKGQLAIKGGSFLCAKNFCARYRPSARQPQDMTLGTNHIGFRTVKNTL